MTTENQLSLNEFRYRVYENEAAPDYGMRHMSADGMARAILALERRVAILERFIQASGVSIPNTGRIN